MCVVGGGVGGVGVGVFGSSLSKYMYKCLKQFVTCKYLGPVWVRHGKYPLLLLKCYAQH